jgi:hypothetical protein
MAITTRQSGLLVAEDWTKLYQTFRNADFQSYDYETLRKSMVEYLRLYYPEDFNDFIESSEFVALLDLIAFLGQSLAFRADLNARENYIDTAQRRDSVLKLARLISYTPKRNIPANGFLKVESVSTTEVVYDSNGINLSGLVINWADAGNDNWLEQMTTVINASLVTNQVISKPSNRQTINGIINDEYQINLIPSLALPTFAFKTNIEGTGMSFEAVSPTSLGQSYVYEDSPRPNGLFNLLYRNDNQGNSSTNTGFFLYFKQGELKSLDVNFQDSIPNRVYGINTNNINNTDVWVYSVNPSGGLGTLWQPVSSVNNTNVIYNKSANKDIYQINSRSNDQIDLIFGDGAFANIPQGRFRIYYRVSNGLQYKITPDEMSAVIIPITYMSRNNRPETINIRASLQYTVANSSPRETLDEIRQKAPQQYYTQDRMVTGEDYNILPYTLFSNILKVKAINRTSSGISRYLDVIDTTGKYSSTNIFAQDGILYRDSFVKSFNFDFATRNDIYRVINNKIKPIASAKETQQFFYAFYKKFGITGIRWHQSTEIANGSTGFFFNDLNDDATYSQDFDLMLQLGAGAASGNTRYIRHGAIVRFSAGEGKYFDARNNIKTGAPVNNTDKYYIYAAIQQIIGDGTNGGVGNLLNGQGSVTVNQVVPTGATVDHVIAVFNNEFDNALITDITNYIQTYSDFGLRYDENLSKWLIVSPENISNDSEFNLAFAGDTSGRQMDSSWLIQFTAQGQIYTVSYRGLDYVFESVQETGFYFDGTTKIYDPKTGFTVHDQIKILRVNSQSDSSAPLMSDYTWFVHKNIVEVDGYENTQKILVTFPDSDSDGVPDNPELFEQLVNPDINSQNKRVYFRQVISDDNFARLQLVNQSLVSTDAETYYDLQKTITLYRDGQLFYIPAMNKFYQLSVSGSDYNINELSGYTAKYGRQNLYFQYRHNSPNNRRIDPSPNNIIDLYILSKQYAADYTAWVRDTSNKVIKPHAPTSEELKLEFSRLENYKTISDSLIYNPVKFKPIFGAKADPNLQAMFKVVKNPNVVVSDNDIKTSVVAAINQYFDLANWDFGETFYFSELNAYLHQSLAPNIASVIIVPASKNSVFGSLLQINAEYNEVIISAATVDNVQIITAITAAQINQNVIV